MERITVPSPWLSPTECAAYMHKSKGKVDAWIRTGALPSHKDPEGKNGVLVYAPDVDEFMLGWPSGARVGFLRVP